MTLSDDEKEFLPLVGTGARPGWNAAEPEEVLEPSLPIVDPHHHLWGGPRPPYELSAFQADIADGHNIVASVFIECSEGIFEDGPEHFRSVGEVQHIARMTRQFNVEGYNGPRICAGIVGYADLHIGASIAEVLAAQVEVGEGRLRGIRQFSDQRSKVRTTTPGLFRRPGFIEGLAKLAEFSLIFEAWVHHDALDDTESLVKRFPEIIFVINHAGGPLGVGPYRGQMNQVREQWDASMRRLAQYPNTVVKIGGLGMPTAGFDFHERAEPPSSEELAQAWKPYVETCIEAFSPQRAMFESNFPVDAVSSSYRTLWNAFKRLTHNFSLEEKSALFSRTAERIYRLDLPAPVTSPA
ncbi:amidohydrolase family protein [Chelativorans sp. Marseille-P2723]|uniref:amidohydrolase family protein n=1 Tax=Chelativorans sp. Marseille-P2723 TaxID=2709133 RepID=UPI00156DA634|nr:amidohydrolase family protein [Chelativorans sp. Marseille-P2723]